MNIPARAGTQDGLGVYARVNRTPSLARASRCGVFTAGFTRPRWSNRCSSVIRNRIFGRFSAMMFSPDDILTGESLSEQGLANRGHGVQDAGIGSQ